mgnify:CR=1 FL=1
MSKNTRNQLPVLYRKTSGLLQNINFLTRPTSLPMRSRKVSYSIFEESGNRLYKIKVEGEYQMTRVPNTRDAKILRAFLSKAKFNKKGRWIARFKSGQEIYNCLYPDKFTKFNPEDSGRVWQALLNWMDVVVLFDGTYQVKGKKLPIKKAFHVLDEAVKKKMKSGRLRYTVEFNDRFVQEILYGLNTRLNLRVYFALSSPFTAQLYEHLTGMFAFQEETVALKIPLLMDKLGLKGSKTLAHEQRRINRIEEALAEINKQSHKYGVRYRVRVQKAKRGERRLVFEKCKKESDDDED